MSKQVFYLYRPLTNIEHYEWLENYLAQKIWFTPLNKFNDPYEGRFDFVPASIQEIFSDSDLLKEYLSGLEVLPSEVKRALVRLLEAENIKHSKFDTTCYRMHGALCLTKTASSLPMWAHYASNHKGYCVVIEIDLDILYEFWKKQAIFKPTHEGFILFAKKLFGDLTAGECSELLSFGNHQEPDKEFMFGKVRYQKELPKIQEIIWHSLRNSPHEMTKYLFQNSVLVKNIERNYENESRIIVNISSENFGLINLRQFHFLKVTGIILGESIGLCSDELMENLKAKGVLLQGNSNQEKLRNHLADLSHAHQLDCYYARCIEHEYALTWKKIN